MGIRNETTWTTRQIPFSSSRCTLLRLGKPSWSKVSFIQPQLTMAELVSPSTAANVAAAISLADVAFKTGTQVFGLYYRYRDASSSISQLVDETKAATTNAAQVRMLMSGFEASAFAIDRKHTISQVQQLLCRIDQWLKLSKKLMEANHSTSCSWICLVQSVAAQAAT